MRDKLQTDYRQVGSQQYIAKSVTFEQKAATSRCSNMKRRTQTPAKQTELNTQHANTRDRRRERETERQTEADRDRERPISPSRTMHKGLFNQDKRGALQ